MCGSFFYMYISCGNIAIVDTRCFSLSLSLSSTCYTTFELPKWLYFLFTTLAVYCIFICVVFQWRVIVDVFSVSLYCAASNKLHFIFRSIRYTHSTKGENSRRERTNECDRVWKKQRRENTVINTKLFP